MAIGRREFLAVLSGAAVWPLAARAQQPQRVRRIGILVGGLAADDPEWQARGTAFVQALAQLGWTDGRNLRIDYRWGLSDADHLRKYAAELVALAPDALLAEGAPAVAALQTATRALPIVFANVGDPAGNGFVASLAQPGGNMTGFRNIEYGASTKWLQLLKQIAPNLRRVAVLQGDSPADIGQFDALEGTAPSFRVEVVPIVERQPGEIERDVTLFARGLNNGLIVTSAGTTKVTRELVITLAERHRLAAIYPFRRFVDEGGLISYGIDQAESYRVAAGYVDRILKGENPGGLPVRAPTRYETVLNLKTAKALGYRIPPALLAVADEIIE